MAIGEMGGVCSLKVLASALGWLLWFPVPVGLSPVVNAVLYPGVSQWWLVGVAIKCVGGVR